MRMRDVFLLVLLAAGGRQAWAEDAGSSAAPKAEAKSPAKAAEASSVKENIKQLGREVSDPGALPRIKAHEQDLEKKIKAKREQQRKDHGRARPRDAVDLTKSLDKPAPRNTPAKPDTPKPGAN